MDIADLIELAERWDKLGWAVQGQLKAFLDDADGDYNPNALEQAKSFLTFCQDRGIEGVEWAIDTIDERLTADDAEA